MDVYINGDGWDARRCASRDGPTLQGYTGRRASKLSSKDSTLHMSHLTGIALRIVLCIGASLSWQPLTAQTSGPPPAYPSGPLNIVFRGSIKPSVLGNAHVFSNPAGIDCPTTCSFQFSAGKPIQLTVVADSSSFAGNIGPPCSQGGSTAPPHPGNTVMCTLLVGAVGNVIVYVDPFPLPTSPAILGSGRNPYGNGTQVGSQSQQSAPVRNNESALSSGLVGPSTGTNCTGSNCLTVLAVRTGTRCGSATSVEVDIRNDSNQYLRGFIVFDTPGRKVYAPTDIMSPGQVERGTQFVCKTNSAAVSTLANIGPSQESVRYPPIPK
jgi:hypothetical protein